MDAFLAMHAKPEEFELNFDAVEVDPVGIRDLLIAISTDETADVAKPQKCSVF